MPEYGNFDTIPQIIDAAHRRLETKLSDWIAGGADSELTVERNRDAFEHWSLRARVLRDVSQLDLGAQWLGEPLKTPLLAAPVGFLSLFHPEGGKAVLRAAQKAGAGACVGALVSPPLELGDVADTPWATQLYSAPGRAWVQERIAEAEGAGARGVCLTVDTPVYGRRERDILNGFSMAGPPPDDSGVNPLEEQARTDWAYVDWLRCVTRLKLILKGIRCGEDARLAVEHGADVVWLSNHGGRQLDHEPGTLEVLPEVAKAVAGRAQLVFDGGVQRGTDVLKALALGADVVAIGKLQLYALAAGGESGLARVLQLLTEELRVSMANLGCAGLAQLDEGALRPRPR